MATYTNEDIVRYVEDELSSDERRTMEEDLRFDAALAERVALYRELKGTLEQRLPGDEGAAALRQTLGGMRGRFFGGAGGGDVTGGGTAGGSSSDGTGGARVVKMKVGMDGIRKYVVGIAAAAAVLFAVVMFWPSDYLDKYGRTQMVGVTERGGSSDTLMEQASVLFNTGAFDKALPLLDQAYRMDTTNQTALFYRGVARLHAGATDEARHDLQKVYAGGSLFQYEAAFYMALSYAQKGDKKTALLWIDKIPAGAPGADKATGLRKQLD